MKLFQLGFQCVVSFALWLHFCGVQAQVRIHEVMASNGSVLADAQGDFEDWIELHNPGEHRVDLSGWGLSDDGTRPFKWVFPEGTALDPDQYLLVWASGKDRSIPRSSTLYGVEGLVLWLHAGQLAASLGATAEDLESGVFSVARWPDLSGLDHHALQAEPRRRPVLGATEQGTGARYVRFQGDPEVLYVEHFGRNFFNNRPFTVFFRNRSVSPQFGLRANEAFGREASPRFFIERASASYGGLNNLVLGHEPNTFATYTVQHDGTNVLSGWVHGQLTAQRALRVLDSLGGPGHLWLPNQNDGVLLAGDVTDLLVFNRSLTDPERALIESKIEAWQAPSSDLENPPWIADRVASEVELHTNFRLSGAGETVLLVHRNGQTVDQVQTPRLPRDIAYGRQQHSTDEWVYFLESTPGRANDGPTVSGLVPEPVLHPESGRYPSPVDIELAAADPSVVYRFTTDGSLPTEFSPVWPGSIRIESAESNAPPEYVLGRIPTNPGGIVLPEGLRNMPENLSVQWGWRPPGIPENTLHVLRVRGFKEGHRPSDPVAATYWIPEPARAEHDLPVVSLIVDPEDFFGEDHGIYVPGQDYLENGWPPPNPWGMPFANYFRRGPTSEREGHVTFYDRMFHPEWSGLVGTRIHGGGSRAMPQKSLRLYARSHLGSSFSGFHPFPEGSPLIDQRLLLRNSGQDSYSPRSLFFRDALVHALVAPLSHIASQRYQPCVLYLNGEYWGIHNLRERVEPALLAATYQVDPDDLDFLTYNNEAQAGSDIHYQHLLEWLRTEDIQQERVYDQVTRWMDMTNYIDYCTLQIFIANRDWPGNNVDYWRVRNPQPNPANPYADGRWRWILYDTDMSTGSGLTSIPDRTRTLQIATATDGPAWPNPDWSTFLLRTLLQNETFRNDFICRMADLLNSLFVQERFLDLIDSFAARLASEMPRHIDRWTRPDSIDAWHQAIEIVRTFARARPGIVRQHYIEFFDLPGLADITVDAHPGGFLRVHRLDIHHETPGLPDPTRPYPWTGTYFAGVPLRIEAVPEPGYRFAGWAGYPDWTEPVLEIDPAEFPEVLTAQFEALPVPLLVHYWSFNQPEALLSVTHSIHSGALSVETGDATEITYSEGQGFNGLNARLGHEAGYHLRLNDPLGSVLTFHLPTDQLNPVFFRYEARRSGQGAGGQRLEYSVDGETFLTLGEVILQNADPVRIEFDLEGLEGVADNPLFTIRLTVEQGDGGTAGNQRIDNVTLEGFPLEGVPGPPVVLEDLPNLAKQAGESPVFLDPATLFVPKEEFPVEFSAESENPEVAEVQWIEDRFEVMGLTAGQTTVVVVADSGSPFGISEVRLPVTVYPAAFAVSTGSYAFGYWDAEEPEGSYPVHMVFVQSQVSDPELDAPLPDFYRLDTEAYHEDDIGTIGFPYNNTRRTRITGLGERGISFLNTGQERDLGGALLVLDTRGVGAVDVGWVAEVLTESERPYGLRLQYRVGSEAPFEDVLLAGEAVELLSVSGVGEQVFQFRLPAALMEQSSLQLLWRYYALGGGSGPRPEIRLDAITVQSVDMEMVYPPEGAAIAGRSTWVELEKFSHTEYAGRVQVDGEVVLDFDEIPRGFLVPLVEGNQQVRVEVWPEADPENITELTRHVAGLSDPALHWAEPEPVILQVGGDNLTAPGLMAMQSASEWRGYYGWIPWIVLGVDDVFGGREALYLPGADLGGSPEPVASGIYLRQNPPPIGGPYLVSAWLRSESDPFPVELGMSDEALQSVEISSQWQLNQVVVAYPEIPNVHQHRIFQVHEQVPENPGWFVCDVRVYGPLGEKVRLIGEGLENRLRLLQNNEPIEEQTGTVLETEVVVDRLGYTVLLGEWENDAGAVQVSEPRVLYVGEVPQLKQSGETEFSLEVTGEVGQIMHLEYSPDLIEWERVSHWVQRQPTESVDPEPPDPEGPPQGYYRVVQWPTLGW